MKKDTLEMTQGNPLSLILRFGWPLILANTLQQLYAMVDTFILGRCMGVSALAVLGVASWPNWLLIGIITSFGQGCSIVIASYFGSKDLERMKRTIGNATIMALVLAVVLTLVAQISLKALLTLIHTPTDIFDETMIYLRITFWSAPLLIAYNVAAALHRAVGDGNTPLYTIVAATILKIVLMLFVAEFDLGIVGAAAATALAQGFAAVVCVIGILRKKVFLLERRHLKWASDLAWECCRLSIPMITQSLVIAVGGLYVQDKTNAYGSVFAAGMSATGKLFGLLETAAISLAQSVATFVSQNLGARKLDRIQKGVRVSLVISLGVAAFLFVTMLATGKNILGFFVTANDPETTARSLNTAWNLLLVMSAGLLVMYPMYVLRHTLQALGDAWIPMIAGFVQLLARIASVEILPRYYGENGLYFSTFFAWITSLLILGIVYPIRLHQCRDHFGIV